jgi:hypothetical protein
MQNFFQVDYATATQKCCQLNMTLAYFPTMQDFNCFMTADTGQGIIYTKFKNNQKYKGEYLSSSSKNKSWNHLLFGRQ